MYGVELGVMIAATFSLSISGGAPGVSIIGVTIFWRVILGIGVGGDYPTSSIITSEFASVRWRGAMMAAVFANQGFGQFAAALISFICAVSYKSSLQTSECGLDCQSALDQSWRILYGLGIVPAVVALYFRLTMPETIRYTLDVVNDERGAVADAEHYTSGRFGSADRRGSWHAEEEEERRLPKASVHDFIRHFGRWKTGKVLLGTAGSWFLLDVAFVCIFHGLVADH
jgi:MFS transporter, PHS family, inorganic phosphate transporter